jgi:RimJ/RimL family protein N-acetyltransferase
MPREKCSRARCPDRSSIAPPISGSPPDVYARCVIWTFDYPLRTERLLLRPHTLGDLDDLVVFHSDPAVTRYIPWPVRNREQTLDVLTVKLGQASATSPGDWIVLAIEERSSGRVVGEILLKRKSDTEAELGYVLATSAQGKGLITEAATVLLAEAERAFGVTTVDATVEKPNAASVRVLTRLGFGPIASDDPDLLTFRRPAPATGEPAS